MTPGEFGDSAQGQLELSDKSLDGLTDLYEEARYSEHEISGEQSKRAEQYYDKIADDITKESDESTSTDDESIVDRFVKEFKLGDHQTLSSLLAMAVDIERVLDTVTGMNDDR